MFNAWKCSMSKLCFGCAITQHPSWTSDAPYFELSLILKTKIFSPTNWASHGSHNAYCVLHALPREEKYSCIKRRCCQLAETRIHKRRYSNARMWLNLCRLLSTFACTSALQTQLGRVGKGNALGEKSIVIGNLPDWVLGEWVKRGCSVQHAV
jgi:hypothetical protein